MHSIKLKVPDLLIKVFLILLGLSFIYPLVWMLTLSFKNKDEVFGNPFGLPKVFDGLNYFEAVKTSNFIRMFSNSVIYSVATVILVIFVSSMFAYCTSRMKWRFSKASMSFVSLGLIIPVQIVIIPIFLILKTLHLKDSYFGLILPYAAFAVANCTLMLFAFFRTLPNELEEAACMDGCNIYSSFFRIILPMVKPAIVTQIVIIFMNTWNEFFMAFILATNKYKPLTVGLLDFLVSIGRTDWGIIGAAMIISSLPTVLIYLVFSEQIENALTAGAILK
jgi:ABC-type sugar transport system, permease component